MDDSGGIFVFGEGMMFVLLFVTTNIVCAKIKNISSSLLLTVQGTFRFHSSIVYANFSYIFLLVCFVVFDLIH